MCRRRVDVETPLEVALAPERGPGLDPDAAPRRLSVSVAANTHSLCYAVQTPCPLEVSSAKIRATPAWPLAGLKQSSDC